MILFMKLKDLHGQVMVKKKQNEISNIISAQKNLNTYVDVNSDVSAALYRYRKLPELEQIHLTYSAYLFLNCGQL